MARRVGGEVRAVPVGVARVGGPSAAEDLVGAGAIISYLEGEKSPEARLAESAFLHFRDEMGEFLRGCVSGRELIERGFGEDVALAGDLDVSESVPLLVEGAYRRIAS